MSTGYNYKTTPLPPAPTGQQYAVQASCITELLNAVQQTLIAATGLNTRYIVETYDDTRPREGEPRIIEYCILDEMPDMYAGASRYGQHSYLYLELGIITRLAVDLAGTDEVWNRDMSVAPDLTTDPPVPAGRGNLYMRLILQNAFQGQFLRSTVDNHILTIEPLQQLKTPGPVKPAPFGDRTCGISKMYFQMKYIQPMLVSTTQSA